MQSTDRLKQEQKLFYLNYFLIGSIANVAVVLLPFFFISKGMNSAQIVLLISMTYLSSIFQPFLGYITDVTIGPKKMLEVSAFMMIILSFLMYILTGFYALLILTFLISIFRNANFPFFDTLTLNFTKDNNLNYGALRKGASLGFGLGAFLASPLVYFNGPNSIVLLTIILSTILIFNIKKIKYDTKKVTPEEEITHYKSDFKDLIKTKKYIILIMAHLLVVGITSLKLSYQSQLIDSKTDSILYMVVLNFIIVLPEILFISKTEKLFKKYDISVILFFILFINIFHTIFLYKANSLLLILLFASLHGIVMSIYLPNFFVYFNNILPKKVLTTGFLINAMNQSIGSFLINTFLILPFVIKYDIRGSFIAITILFITGFIPVYLLYKLNKKDSESQIQKR